MRSALVTRLARLEESSTVVERRRESMSPLLDSRCRREAVERGVTYEQAMAEHQARTVRIMADYRGDGSSASVLRHCRQVRHLESQRSAALGDGVLATDIAT
jgi:hypothetical protein